MSDNDLGILHTTKFVYTLDEYIKGAFVAPTRIQRIQHRVVPSLCFTLAFWLRIRNRVEGHLVGWFTLLSFLFFVLLLHILIPIIFTPKISKQYKSNPVLDGLIVNYAFSADGIELRSFTANNLTTENKVLRYRYNDFEEVIETRANFYLLLNKLDEQSTFIILKENCTPELVEFIRDLPVKKRYQRK